MVRERRERQGRNPRQISELIKRAKIAERKDDELRAWRKDVFEVMSEGGTAAQTLYVMVQELAKEMDEAKQESGDNYDGQ